ncbi:glycoside hydrolase family 25 protein [Flammeovirga sp. EKP202]|uniref:glycoside hydrolase family 25 protein n=1 Tax=Flammeovirga sp. EKP202 TaxID=2770592 RepID=UPI00165F8E53|nr:GH25 family lysozyme [Flammeovirga sp. EKP202]MBD0400691.1 glycoside hydrolase family 25 protein [Flammeovirga sp. EKP202]
MRKKVNIFPFSSFVLLFFMALGYYINVNQEAHKKFAPYLQRGIDFTLNLKDYVESPFYKNFKGYGVKLPDNYSVHGIDISHHQKLIDFQRVSAFYAQNTSIKFVYAKATEGKDHKDRHFDRNRNEIREHNLLFGAYHFFRPKTSGKEQAEYFIKTVGALDPSDLVPVVDIEVLDGVDPSLMRDRLEEFVLRVEEEYGVKPMIYTGDSFYKDYFKGHFRKYRVWIANYGQSTKAPKARWTMWQHTQEANIDGIPNKVDMNVFDGNWEKFQKSLLIGHQKGYKQLTNSK